MEKIIDKNIILFNIALEYDIIDISIITSWADNHILNNEIDANDYFIIELSWAHTKERIQEIFYQAVWYLLKSVFISKTLNIETI